MKLRLANRLEMREYLVAGIVVMSAAAIYALLVQPSLRLYAEIGQAVSVRDQVLRERERLEQQYELLQQQIASTQVQLDRSGGTPPSASDRDLQVAKVTLLAGECHVGVDEYVPIGAVVQGNCQASFVQFTARATFADCRRFLRRLETELDYIDVTHLSIKRQAGDEKGQCVISWSCRINGLIPPGPALHAVQPKAIGGRQARGDARDALTVEVASHGS